MHAFRVVQSAGSDTCSLFWSGDRAAAVEAYKKVEETAAGSGLKMDNVFTMLRCSVQSCINTSDSVGKISLLDSTATGTL
jgi:hypothetical protein